MKTVAFIPARGGSKGIPGKNKKLFHGKPLVQWSIEQAKDTGIFDKIFVSSDDPDILEIADKCGVVPVERQAVLSKDETTSDAVLFDFFARPENECKHICQLNPTSPLRLPKDITGSYKFIQMKKYWTVVSVKWSDFIGWVGKPTKKGGPVPSYNIGKRPNRQARNDFFLENGSIYWSKFESFVALGNMIGDHTKVKLYEMPEERNLEIDTPFDFYMAERAYEYRTVEKSD